MTAEKSPEVGWLHYRLAVAVCSVFVAGVMMLIVPLVIGIVGRGTEPLALYAIVFSKWGLATLIVSAILGFTNMIVAVLLSELITGLSATLVRAPLRRDPRLG